MSTRRIFIAVVPPENIINSLIKTIRSYKKESWGKDVKWIKPEHLHLTLKFTGQVESNKIAKISSAVKAATHGFWGLTAEISKLRVFPKPLFPKVLSAGIDENTSLLKLAENIENSLYTIGISKEKRKFKGHITLGRYKKFISQLTKGR